MIPLHVARRIQAVVFEKKNGQLGVAMTTPRSPAALEELASYLGPDITPHVATEVGILAALDEVKEETTAAVPSPSNASFIGAGDAWDRLWSPPRLRSRDLLRVKHRKDDRGGHLASTYPGLAPIPEGGQPGVAGPLEDKVYRQLLREVVHRDEIGDLLLRRASAVLDRSCLLAVHSGKVVGWVAG